MSLNANSPQLDIAWLVKTSLPHIYNIRDLSQGLLPVLQFFIKELLLLLCGFLKSGPVFHPTYALRIAEMQPSSKKEWDLVVKFPASSPFDETTQRCYNS